MAYIAVLNSVTVARHWYMCDDGFGAVALCGVPVYFLCFAGAHCT